MRRPANRFVKTLQERGLTIAFAESMTCGMLSAQLSKYAGTADVLQGSVVCYTPEVKNNLLKIPQRMIDECTCESMEVTEALVKKLPHLIRADIHAAVTGLASPGGSETRSKPVGTVFLCFSYTGKIHKMRVRFYGTPSEIRQKACEEFYRFILDQL